MDLLTTTKWLRLSITKMVGYAIFFLKIKHFSATKRSF